MKTVTKVRNPAMDVIRCFALFLVVSVHFFARSGYYGKLIVGGQMMLLTVLRCVSMTGVALFLMLSGYLMNRKKLSGRYYKGLIKTLAIYILCSIVCYLYRYFFNSSIAANGSLGQLISETFNYIASAYGWYIRMYIGLFLLIPFLNTMYHGLETQRAKQILVLTLLTLTALPCVTNIFTYAPGKGLFLATHSFQQILPSWWLEFYPITYYILGAYLSEYPLPLKFWPSFGITLGTIVIAGGFNIYISRGDVFCYGPWQEDASFLNAIQAFMIFHTLSQIDFSRWNGWKCSLFAKISDLCLGAYLLSWIFDDYFYPLLLQHYPTSAHQLKFYLLMVPANYLFSLILSAGVNLLYHAICKLLPTVKRQ